MTLIGTGMKRGLFAAAALAGLMALGADPALARGNGNMGAGAAGSHAGGGASGGQSSGHVDAHGTLNTNGPNAADRDFGRDRAEDRGNGRLNHTGFTGHDNGRDNNNGRFNNHRWRHGRHHHYGWR